MGQISDGSTADYYQLPPGCTELQDLISYRNLNAQDGEIFRAIYRKGRASHSDELRDARKVLFYAQAEVKRLEELQSVPQNWGQQNTIEPAAAIDDARPDIVASSHGDGEHYAELEKLERWKDAPEWAGVLLTHKLSGMKCFSESFCDNSRSVLEIDGTAFGLIARFWDVLESRP